MNHSLFRTTALAILAVAFAASPVLGSEGVATLGSAPPEEESAVTTTGSDDPMDGLLDYAACMREHGVDMPDPQLSGGGFVMAFEASADTGADQLVTGSIEDIMGSEFVAADEACSHHLGAMVTDHDPAQDAEIMEQLLAHAKCMRDNGIDMPDPAMDGGFVAIGMTDGEMPGFDPFSEEYRSAEEACRDVLPFGDDGVGVSSLGE